MSWIPTSVVNENWARPRLVINDVDVTYYRGVPIEILALSFVEPFGDAAASFRFSQITPFEALPSWLAEMSEVTLYVVHPDGSQEIWFEGLFSSEEDSMAENANGFEIHCLGALFQVDLYRKAPELFRYKNGQNDLLNLIGEQFNRDHRPALKTAGLWAPGWTGITYGEKGSWNQALTGYVQELLAIATSSGMPLPGEPIVGIVSTPSGDGYWLVGSAGSVLPFGDARYYGSMAGTVLTEPASGIAALPDGSGYWFGAKDGGVFSFGYTIGFYGSLGLGGTPYDIQGIEAMPDGLGYVMVDEVGAIFAFGSGGYYGGIGGAMTPFDRAIDLALTPTGLGYWIVTAFGYVYAFGDAGYFGGVDDNTKRIVAMATRADGTGYWLVEEDGTIYEFGAAGAFGPAPVTIRAADITAVGNDGVLVVDEIGGVFAYGTATYQGSCLDGGGHDSQWTVGKEPGRIPKLKVKNTWDTHWTVTVGTPGVLHSLTRDFLMAPNAYYGEGTDPEGCIWRNTKYPNFSPDEAPVFSGSEKFIGANDDEVRAWEQHMYDAGWTDIVVDGLFSQKDSNNCRWFQALAGLVQTGTINAQTWAATFLTGTQAADLTAAYFAPLAVDDEVEPYVYNPRGDIIGNNPNFNPQRLRVETYDNYGPQVTRHEGIASSFSRKQRDYPASYAGTITLKIDPEQGSRFMIRDGQNILLKSYRDTDVLFHIAAVEVDLPNLSVALTVDQKARDSVTLAAYRARVRDVSDPANRPTRHLRNSKVVEDRKIAWDCESGAGLIPRQAISAGVWNVVRIPAGEVGRVVSTLITVDTPARFSTAVFDSPITPAVLNALGASPLDAEYWDGEFWDGYGLVMAWGGDGDAGGFSPGKESEDDPLTGKMLDDSNWDYQSQNPPWLWVGLWVESPALNYIQGRFEPDVF